MKLSRPITLPLGVKIALGAAVMAAATGAAFAAWVENGEDMIVSLFEAGLAWCF